MRHASEEFRREYLRVLEAIVASSYYPKLETVIARKRENALVKIAGVKHWLVNCSVNDYLGLATNWLVRIAAAYGMLRWGLGSGASRLTGGNLKVHEDLEKAAAKLAGKEDAVLFSSGYLANIGLILALLNSNLRMLARRLGGEEKKTIVVVYYDKKVHASILDGLALASSPRYFGDRVKLVSYSHLDMEDLRDKLQAPVRTGEGDKTGEDATVLRIIFTDGVFSLHGHLVQLDALVALADEYGAAVYVDDAHGTGVFGLTGRGTAEHFGVASGVDFNLKTLSKAIGGEGAVLAADHETCQFLRIAARSYMYQTAMSPGVACGLLMAIRLMGSRKRRERVRENASYMRKRLEELGFDIFGSTTQIIPVAFGTEQQAKQAYEILLREGVFAPIYYPPAVERAMVRINIIASHRRYHLDRIIAALEVAREEVGLN